MDKEDFADMDKDEIIAATATDHVGEDKYDNSDAAKWTVDFESVARGFLSVDVHHCNLCVLMRVFRSSEIPECFDFETLPEIRECTNIMRNFYNYIMHHSVCPEYTNAILAARHICDLADKELYQTHKVLRLLPGSFNIACSTIFGGRHKDTYSGDSSWLKGDDAEIAVGLSSDAATKVFKYGVAALGTDDYFSSDDAETIQHKILDHNITSIQHNVGLEVMELVPADPDHVALHNTKRGLGKGQALGKLICRPYTVPNFDTTDLPPNYTDTSSSNKEDTIYEFWLEQHILDFCFVGMKLEASVGTLSNGMHFLDHVVAVKCSFYTLMYNDFLLLTKWKEPVEITREQHMQKIREKVEWEEEMKRAENDGMLKPKVESVQVEKEEVKEEEKKEGNDETEEMKHLVEEDVD